MSKEKADEVFSEASKIAEESASSTADVLSSVSTNLTYGYSIDYIMEKMKNHEPIASPFEYFHNAYSELYDNLKWHQKLWLHICDVRDSFVEWAGITISRLMNR